MQNIPWWHVYLGEAAAKAAHDAVAQGKMTLGDRCAEFEARIATILNVPHVVSVSSGTAALTIALLEAGLEPGMEVIVPDQTWIATAHAPMLLGARVVLVDVEKDRRVMSPQNFEQAITPRTKAVIPVHLNGKAANIPAIRAIAEKHNIAVIEDAAQAFTSRSEEGWLGVNARCGCFSLSMGKFISCGQGGYVVTDDPERARRLRLARIHGTKDIYAPTWEIKGGNFRFWDLPASIALTQLDMLERRREALKDIYRRYYEALNDLDRVRVTPFNLDAGELPLYVECLSAERDALMAFLAQRGIQCRAKYPPLHEAPHFSAQCEKTPFSEQFAHSLRFGRECFVLPCGPDRTPSEIETTIKAVRLWHSKAQ